MYQARESVPVPACATPSPRPLASRSRSPAGGGANAHTHWLSNLAQSESLAHEACSGLAPQPPTNKQGTLVRPVPAAYTPTLASSQLRRSHTTLSHTPTALIRNMTTRKRKNEDEELVALPSDEEESEEE
jgi:hypothetical protein